MKLRRVEKELESKERVSGTRKEEEIDIVDELNLKIQELELSLSEKLNEMQKMELEKLKELNEIQQTHINEKKKIKDESESAQKTLRSEVEKLKQMKSSPSSQVVNVSANIESSVNTDELQREIKELAESIKALEKKRAEQKDKVEGTLFQRRICILKNGKLRKDGALPGSQVLFAVPQSSSYKQDDFGGVAPEKKPEPTLEPKPMSRGQSILLRTGSVMSSGGARNLLQRKPTTIEVTSKTNAPSSDTQLYRNGYLTKEGEIMKTWKKRWFRIHDHYLSYYNNAGDTNPLKSLNLKGAKVSVCPSKTNNQRPHVFELKVGTKSLYLSASTDEELKQWISSLNQIIEKVNNDKSIKEGGEIDGDD